VSLAIAFARENDLEIAVRGGREGVPEIAAGGIGGLGHSHAPTVVISGELADDPTLSCLVPNDHWVIAITGKFAISTEPGPEAVDERRA